MSRPGKRRRKANRPTAPATSPRGAADATATLETIDELRRKFFAGDDDKIPRAALRFDAPCVFDLAGLADHDDDEDEKPDSSSRGSATRAPFKAVVNSGEVIHHWFWGQFAIDMEGLEIPTQLQPVLRDHDTSKILGMTSSIAVSESKTLEAAGELVGIGPDAEEVMAWAQEGFPFQMSVYVPPSQILEVREGEEVEVNGHKLVGPGTIFKKSTLREVTVTPLGADANTSLALLAHGSKPEELDTVSCSVSRLSTHEEEDMSPPPDDVDEEVGTLTAAEAEKLATKRAEEAMLAERARLAGIDELADGTGVPPTLVAKMKADGLSVEASAVEIVKLAKAGKTALLSQLADDSPDLSADEGDEDEFTEGEGDDAADADASTATPTPTPKTKKLTAKKIAAMKLGEARFKAEWAADYEKCNSEFSSEETYVAYQEHEHRAELAEQDEVVYEV